MRKEINLNKLKAPMTNFGEKKEGNENNIDKNGSASKNILDDVGLKTPEKEKLENNVKVFVNNKKGVISFK